MLHHNHAQRDQYVPSDQYLPDVKMEEEEEAYYKMYGNVNKFNSANNSEVNYNNNNNFKVPPISTFCTPTLSPQFYNNNNNNNSNNRNELLGSNYMVSNEGTSSPGLRSNYMISSDGESSPKSVEEIETTPVYCVRGVRTITRNPGRISRQRNTATTKCRGRGGRRTEYTVPKEKDRARLFNEAFDCLRKRIPSIPASKKLSKIEILRLAICYMSYLKFLLEPDTPTNYDSPTSCSTNSCSISLEGNAVEEVARCDNLTEDSTQHRNDAPSGTS